MASVSGTNSTTNSFFNTYGNANAITGLASGMDTEGMIEQAVSGFQRKIESLQQKQTIVQWKQSALRSMITMLNGLNNKYASYTSKTNLLSPAFFTSAMTNTVLGVNADKISVTGGSSSNVSINSVSKLATAATCRVSAGAVFSGTDGTGDAINWANLDISKYAEGSIVVTLDGASKAIRVGDLGKVRNTDDLAAALQKKLDDAFGKGRVTVGSEGGALKFGSSEGSSVKAQSNVGYLGLGSGVTNYLDITNTKVINALCKDNGDGTFTFNGTTYKDVDGYLVDDKGNTLTLEINGTKIDVSTKTSVANLISNINLSDAGVTVSYSQLTNQLTFTSRETGAGSKIEFGGALGSAFQPSNSPEDIKVSSLFSDIEWDKNGQAVLQFSAPGLASADGKITLNKTDTMQDLIEKIESIGAGDPESPEGYYKGMFRYDAASGTYGLYDESGNPLAGEKFSLGVPGGKSVTLSELTEKAGSVNSSFTPGQDAELNVTINGVETKLTRSSNTFDIDGMSVTLKDTFEEGAVTFTGKVDAEKIVSAVKGFVEDYNALITAVRAAYTTQPLEKNSSSHTKYEPLTDADKEGLSEKAIAEYEEKAKTGLLFMDSDLSGLYSSLRSILVANKSALAEIGISLEYDSDSRVNYLEVDEDKLSAVLENDISKVTALFTGEDGLMSSVQSTVKTYASTAYGDYGILVSKAGADESAISQRDNKYQNEIERLENQIESWKAKLSSKVDYYSRQFTMLEQLMSNFNNQSSMLMSMMGY